MTGLAHNQPSRFAMIERVWTDPAYRAALARQEAAWHRNVNDGFDAHTRRALAIRDTREAFETMALEILDAADAAKGVL